MQIEISRITERIEQESGFVDALIAEVGKVIVGQRYMVERLLVGLLTGGHVLVEGVPGLAKTLAIKTLAGALRASFQRVQFTPDLLPADLIGTLIYDQRSGGFRPRKGPIFANLILGDEINRAPAKVQSALLEAMQEKHVTIGEETFALPDPFLVMATQNPIEHEGTYPLPEAQIDRFMMKLKVEYPSRQEEAQIVRRMTAGQEPVVAPVVDLEHLVRCRAVISEIYVDDRLHQYILDLVRATRDPGAAGIKGLSGLIEYGASPRASICLLLAARAQAFLCRRGYVTPDDLKGVAPDVLRHRLILTYEAEAEEVVADDVVQRLLEGVEAP